ncbi:NDP-sugar synthase [Candidatus Bathyarchaeota archaeon]|nr:NDP-sugar synthase [Candidatus Bathyarchaeota archaeon]
MSRLRALILAGGFGTRLRPLSCTLPKIMFPVAGRPMIELVLSNLYSNGVDEAVLAIGYMADVIRRHLGRRFEGMRLHYSLEETPMGTGGAVKKAERFLRDGDFFVLNSDIIASPPLQEILSSHVVKDAAATIMLHRVKDPTHFGVAKIDRSLRIERFVEKPRRGDAPSRWINAGVYVLDPEVFDYLPPGRKASIEREVFPKLASSRRLYGYRYNGEWFDIGRFEEYKRANRAALSRLSRNEPSVGSDVRVHADARLVPPLRLGPRSRVGAGATLGPYSSVGESVVVGEGSKVSGSILFSRVHVGKNSHIRNAVVGEGAVVGENVRIWDGCVIGDKVYIHDGVRLVHDVTVCPHKEVTRSITCPGVVT